MTFLIVIPLSFEVKVIISPPKNPNKAQCPAAFRGRAPFYFFSHTVTAMRKGAARKKG